jgi:uncharacterized protein (TIGR03437 family)
VGWRFENAVNDCLSGVFLDPAELKPNTAETSPKRRPPFINEVSGYEMSSFFRYGFAVMLTTLLLHSALADGDLDPGFAPRIFKAGRVRDILVQSDGKILIVGDFKTVNGVSRTGIARLNADGSLDTSFDASGFTVNLNNVAIGSRIAQQSDGRILVLGPNNLIRLNEDGSLDQSFRGPTRPPFISQVLLQPDGKILGMIEGARLIRLNSDGSPDAFAYGGTVFSQGTTRVAIALQPDGKILVGGHHVNPIGATSGIFLRVNADGSRDSSFNPGTGPKSFGGFYAAFISDIAIQPDGKIILSGNFDYYNGTPVTGIIRLNPDGSLDPSFIAPIPPIVLVRDLLLQPDGRIVIAGDFTSYAGTPRKYLARINTDGSLDSSFDPGAGTSRPPSTLARLPDGRILAGGNFYLAGDEVRLGVASFHPDGRVDSSFKSLVGGRPDSLFAEAQFAALAPGGKIVIAGTFDVVNETARPKLARLNADGTLDGSFAPMIASAGSNEPEFYKLAVQPDGKVLVYVPSAKRFLRLNVDGSEDSSFTPPRFDLLVSDGLIILQPDGKILLSGFGIDSTTRLVRLNPDGTEDTTFRSDAPIRNIFAMALQLDGKVVIADDRRIVRLNANGALDSSFEASFSSDTVIRTLALQPNGKILVGGFSSQQRLVLRLNSDGSPDSSFNTALLGPITSGVIGTLAVQLDGKILVANREGGGVIRLNPDGSRDNSFNFTLFPPNRNTRESISFLLLQPDGQLLVCGSFDRIGFPPGAVRHNLARVRLGEASVVTTVSAASFGATVAPDSIASAFGIGVAGSIRFGRSRPLPTILDGVVVKIKDSAGIEHAAPLFFISPTQINFQVTPATAVGMATLTVEFNGTKLGTGVVNVLSVALGFFTLSADGKGVPAGYAVRVRGATQSFEPIHQTGTANRQEPRPIDLGPEGDQVWLALFGTGIRGRAALSNVTATIGGMNALVGFAGAQGDFIALDQVNLLIPRSLMGRGEVDVVLTVSGRVSNIVKVNIK